MKLLTYTYSGQEAVGVMDQSSGLIIPISVMGLEYKSMNDLIMHATEAELTRLRNAVTAPPNNAIPYKDAGRVAPIPQPRQDVICLGFNYLDHVKESLNFKGIAVSEPPAHPIYFSKRVNQAVAHGGEIQGHFDLDEQLDYEAELAIIIGKDAKNVPAGQAEDYIFGYTIMNDVSARAVQSRHKQFYFGKSMDGFTPMGPWIVTRDEFAAFPPSLAISSYVNDELRQSSSTDHMLFKISHIIEELSSGITLKAGTIIATGTPSGVGFGFSPPRFLKAGDVVECVIEGIGRLQNTVV